MSEIDRPDFSSAPPTPRQVWEASFTAETAVRRARATVEPTEANNPVRLALDTALDAAREATRRALLAIR